MRFVITDYSHLYYVTLSRTSLPVRRHGKFIQIRDDKAEYFLLSPRELSAYHANIVERFFSERRIEGLYNGKRDYYEISAPGWKIVGGGMWAINEDEKVLYLSGSSQAYGRFDQDCLSEKILSIREMAGYTVRID